MDRFSPLITEMQLANYPSTIVLKKQGKKDTGTLYATHEAISVQRSVFRPARGTNPWKAMVRVTGPANKAGKTKNNARKEEKMGVGNCTKRFTFCEIAMCVKWKKAYRPSRHRRRELSKAYT